MSRVSPFALLALTAAGCMSGPAFVLVQRPGEPAFVIHAPTLSPGGAVPAGLVSASDMVRQPARAMTLMLEARPRSRPLLPALDDRGCTTAMPLTSLFAGDRAPYSGGVHALARHPDGSWSGAADPRRDSSAVGLQAASQAPGEVIE